MSSLSNQKKHHNRKHKHKLLIGQIINSSFRFLSFSLIELKIYKIT